MQLRIATTTSHLSLFSLFSLPAALLGPRASCYKLPSSKQQAASSKPQAATRAVSSLRLRLGTSRRRAPTRPFNQKQSLFQHPCESYCSGGSWRVRNILVLKMRKSVVAHGCIPGYNPCVANPPGRTRCERASLQTRIDLSEGSLLTTL